MTEEPDLVGPREAEERDAADLSNDELVKNYFDSIDDARDSTTDFYKRNFKPFRRYVEERNGHLTDDVGSEDIKNFLETQADNYAPKTVGHRLSAITRFYNALHDMGLLDGERDLPHERLDRDKVRGLSDNTLTETGGGDEFHYLEPDEVNRLIENVPAPQLRNRALLMVMANTGLRASEVVRIRLENLDLANKELTVKSPKLSDDLENNPEWITVYWRDQKVADRLDTYINAERPATPNADSPYLFPSKQSERLGTQQVNRIVKEAAENAGLQDTIAEDAAGQTRYTVTSHVLRHSYAMAALDNGMNIDEIRDNLHHEDLETTRKYLRRHEEDRRQAVEKHGPQFG